jgi:hypothetical protein
MNGTPLLKDNVRAFERKLYVRDKIGKLNLLPFEKWAFHYDKGMIYDSRVPFMWSCSHSKVAVPENVDEALEKIIDLWKTTFDSDDHFLYMEIK